MNKKILLFYVLISALGAFILFKVYYLTGLDVPMEKVIDKVRADEKFEFKFRIANTAFGIASASLASFICYKLARKRGKDPKKWAGYGLIFNVFAIIHLFFNEDDESR